MKKITTFAFLVSLLFSSIAFAGELTQSDVDKIIKTTPIIVGWFEKNKGTVAPEIIALIGEGTFDGNLHQAFGKIADSDAAAKNIFETAASSNGFQSYNEYAIAADKAYALLALNTVMSANASMSSDTKIKNVFEYIDKESTPEDQKKRLKGYLPGMYERLNADPKNLPMVLKNFDALKEVLIR